MLYTVQDLLSLDANTGRTTSVGHNEALVLLIGLFIGRAFITSVRLSPRNYDLHRATYRYHTLARKCEYCKDDGNTQWRMAKFDRTPPP